MVSETNDKSAKPVHLRLMELTEEQVKELNYYEILGLGDEPHRATPHKIKQAYRKACVRYHPDKTGAHAEEDNNDYVFIAVKAAWDTLSDPNARKAYDSTQMPFDDSIPPDVAAAAGTAATSKTNGSSEVRSSVLSTTSMSNCSSSSSSSSSGFLYTDDDFYNVFGPVFERNLRFDTRLQEQTSKKAAVEIPSLGDENSPIEQVQTFYDYWVQFDSWRDFSQKAQEELFDNNNPLEDAESRYEKRYYQKEIDKRAKALKRQEMNRIQTLVQRAMAADPRLQKYYREQKEAKEKAAIERELRRAQEEHDAKVAEENRIKEEAEREEREKILRAQEKVQREKEKKQLRKAKQQLRKITVAAFQERCESDQKIFSSLEEMSDELEFLCGELNLSQIQTLTEDFEASRDFSTIHAMSQKRRCVQDQEKEEKKAALLERQRQLEEEERQKAEELAKAKAWTQPELASLAKAVKKFPGGGGRRWDSIASYINSNCRPDEPRTNKECLDKYNEISKASAAKASAAYDAADADDAATAKTTSPVTLEATSTVASSPATLLAQNNNDVADADADINGTSLSDNGTADGNIPKAMSKAGSTISAKSSSAVPPDEWTDDEDKLLQEALAKFPATMDKNERWTSIAKMVTGKSKKQCVQRFKYIRDAIKNKEDKK